MSVSCHIYLPGNVRVKDVMDVMGILVGLPKKKNNLDDNGRNLDDGDPSWYCQVKGVSYRTTHTSEMISIELVGNFSEAAQGQRMIEDNPQNSAFCYWFFEVSSPHEEYRLISCGSTGFWIAVGKGLVKFFGGEVDYNDCDSIDVDFKVKKKINSKVCPSDGVPWQEFQKRKFDLQPLTKEDFQEAQERSAY